MKDDPADDMVGEHHEQGVLDSNPEDGDYWQAVPDPSSAEARKGKDIQGIAWERLAITRENYRLARLEEYKNHENVPNSSEEAIKDCKPTEKGGMYYEFKQNIRSIKSTILHYQVS